MTPKLSDFGSVQCPCGCEFVHFSSVVVDRNGNRVNVRSTTEAEIEQRPEAFVSRYRGAFVDLACFCEDGCCFSLRVLFHKGYTILEIVDYRPEAWAEDTRPGDLWRD